MPDEVAIRDNDNELINAALSVARKLCGHFVRPGLSRDDLFAEVALLAVTEAWSKWPKRGNFVGYATRRVEWRLKSYLKAYSRQRKPPINQIDYLPLVWKGIAYGKERRQIASALKLHIGTVDYYIKKIKEMLDLPSGIGSGALGRIWAERNLN